MKLTPLFFTLCLAGAALAVRAAEPGAAPAAAATAVAKAESGGPEWFSDYNAAVARATAEKKPLLLDFTGSDWCIWCQRLDEEVFRQRPFLDYAERSLVLVTVDFPQHRALPGARMLLNGHLKALYHVTGYPTIVLIDATGRELGRTGYMEGGPKTFVRELKRIVAGK